MRWNMYSLENIQTGLKNIKSIPELGAFKKMVLTNLIAEHDKQEKLFRRKIRFLQVSITALIIFILGILSLILDPNLLFLAIFSSFGLYGGVMVATIVTIHR